MRHKIWLGTTLTVAFLLLSGCSAGSGGALNPLNGIQYLPNMRQQITPLAPPGAQFVGMNPGLADQPDWLVGHAASTVLTESFPPLRNTHTIAL